MAIRIVEIISDKQMCFFGWIEEVYMDYKKESLIIGMLLAFLSPPSYAEKDDVDADYIPCTKSDYEHAEGVYDPKEAYEFGLKIQNAVASEDISALFSLVDDELTYGPRKSFAISTPFDELFEPDFKARIERGKPDCRIGSRGFSIGLGAVWYDLYADGSYHIFSIPDTKQEDVKGIKSVGWPYNGTVLPSKCFSEQWDSSDNYEEYAEQFGITDFDDFTTNMGKYFGREITDLKPIPAWGSTVSLIRSFDSCITTDSQQPEIRDGYVWYNEDYSFRVIGQIPSESCNDLAPHLNNTCSEAFVVQSNSFGGSRGVFRRFYAYGLFELPELGPSIVPLKNLRTLNKSLRWLDDIK